MFPVRESKPDISSYWGRECERKKTPPRGRSLVLKKERDRAVAVTELVARDELDGAAPGVLRGAERQPGTAFSCIFGKCIFRKCIFRKCIFLKCILRRPSRRRRRRPAALRSAADSKFVRAPPRGSGLTPAELLIITRWNRRTTFETAFPKIFPNSSCKSFGSDCFQNFEDNMLSSHY